MLNVVTHKVASWHKDSQQERLKEPTLLRIQVRTHMTILIIRTDLSNLFRETAVVYCCVIMKTPKMFYGKNTAILNFKCSGAFADDQL